MAVYEFLAFKDLYIQTNLRNKFLKKLCKIMNFDLHTKTVGLVTIIGEWQSEDIKNFTVYTYSFYYLCHN